LRRFGERGMMDPVRRIPVTGRGQKARAVARNAEEPEGEICHAGRRTDAEGSPAMISFAEADGTLFTWINAGCSNPILDVIMPWISHLADAAVVWLWLVFIGILNGWRIFRVSASGANGERQTRRLMRAGVSFFLFLALIYGVNSGLCSVLKHAFGRPRPFTDRTVVLRVSPAAAADLQKEGSFPSGHATNAFMLAALLAERMRRRRFAFYGAAVLVALSRIYLGVHFPADVAAGACLGLAATRMMLSFPPLERAMARERFFLSG
jgi:undecaprenyl-diphosphatase